MLLSEKPPFVRLKSKWALPDVGLLEALFEQNGALMSPTSRIIWLAMTQIYLYVVGEYISIVSWNLGFSTFCKLMTNSVFLKGNLTIHDKNN